GPADKMKIFGLSIVFSSLKELNSEQDLENLAYKAAKFDAPATRDYLKPLEQLPNLSKDEKIKVVNEVFSSLENGLSGSDAWQWEMGKNFGGIVTQMRIRQRNGFFSKTEGELLKSRLIKIRDLSYSIPEDIPTDVAANLK